MQDTIFAGVALATTGHLDRRVSFGCSSGQNRLTDHNGNVNKNE